MTALKVREIKSIYLNKNKPLSVILISKLDWEELMRDIDPALVYDGNVIKMFGVLLIPESEAVFSSEFGTCHNIKENEDEPTINDK